MPSTSGTNTYIITISGAEIARLMNRSALLTRSMGSVFPALSDELASMDDVLDLACGPGGWLLDLAFTYPETLAVGVDIDPSLVQYAQAQARARRLPNARFQVMDITQPLAFPAHSFDLVNAQFLSAVLYPSVWPALIAECLRILRPGGVLRLMETELPMCTSRAVTQMHALLAEALFKTGRSFSPDGRTIGITPLLSDLLRDGGFASLEQQPYSIECSAGTGPLASCCRDALLEMTLLKPFYLTAGVITEEAFEALYQQAEHELYAEEFCCLWTVLSVWGRKPR